MGSLRLIGKVMRLRRIAKQLAPNRSTKVRRLRVRSAMDAVPALSPGYGRPTHLRELIYELDKVPYEPIRVVCDVPPRHFKSTTVHHWLAKILSEHPWLKILYVTYGSDFASENVEAIRDLAIRAGVVIGRTDKENKFTTTSGGCVVGAGFDGILTGRGYHVIVVDDAHKNRAEAESRAKRTKVVRGVKSDVFSRKQPGGPRATPRGFKGTSIVVIGTRWNVDDVQGNLLGTSPSLPRRTTSRWKHVHLPAINAKGEALAPDYWPLEALLEIKAEFEESGQLADWLSLYQGDPQPEGGQRFRDILFVDPVEIPKSGRFANGVDLAHTAKTRSDNHAIARMMRGSAERCRRCDGAGKVGDRAESRKCFTCGGAGRLEYFYILDVISRRGPLTTIDHGDGRVELGFVQEIRAAQTASPGARTAQHIGGPEDTTLELLGRLEAEERVYVEGIRTQTEKLQRATPFIVDWNLGRVLVPLGAPWASPLMSKLISFTGSRNDRDDEIDALVTAHHLLSESDGLADVVSSQLAERPNVGRPPSAAFRRKVFI
jgi:predicted phage terminase large subunit-like protein